jgi:hypothetical protein
MLTRKLAIALVLVVAPGLVAVSGLGIGAAHAAAPQIGEAARKGGTPSIEETNAKYEALAQGAVKTHDVPTLLAPFVDKCEAETRDLDRARCRATVAYLRKTLPTQTFAFDTDDPAAIAVSEYDASIKGYHVALAGCVACSAPVTIGRSGEARFVTLKPPSKDGDTLVKAVEVSRNTFGFESLADAKQWFESERPYLRAEFLFKPVETNTEADWTFKTGRGMAVKLLGARIVNRCTGEVLVSKPPSTGAADRPAPGTEDAACTRRAAGRPEKLPLVAEPGGLPQQLSKVAIDESMAKIRPQVFACYQQFHTPGTLELTYVVAGNGTVQSVVVGPTFAGTPTGQCALTAAKDAHFSPFQVEQQKFTYPFFLRQ